MEFIILISCMIYITQTQASCLSRIYARCKKCVLSHSEGHAFETLPTTSTNINEDDLSEIIIDIPDVPDQATLHTTTNLRTCSITMKGWKRNIENGTESDCIGQDKLKKAGTPGQVSSQTSSIINMKLPHKPTKRHGSNVLKDENNAVRDVLPEDISVVEQDFSQEQSVPRVSNPFEGLLNREKYDDIFKLGESMKMNIGEFMKQLCRVIKTFKQYCGIVRHFKNRNLVAVFYVYGDMEIVKKAIITESSCHNKFSYDCRGDLETALHLALNEDNYDRVIELFKVKQEVEVGQNDVQLKRRGGETSFEYFVREFIDDLAPWKDGMPFKRFLTLRGDELRSNHSDILDLICQKLVYHLKRRLDYPKVEKLLIDLIGQPLLLTSISFTRTFLGNYYDCLEFIEYGWREAIEEGLKIEYPGGGEGLWREMKRDRQRQFPEEFPHTADARTAVCKHFPTKQQKEEEWVKENVKLFCNKLNSLGSISNVFPTDLWSIISEYVISSWLDTQNLTLSTK